MALCHAYAATAELLDEMWPEWALRPEVDGHRLVIRGRDRVETVWYLPQPYAAALVPRLRKRGVVVEVR
jgi:hypothetical protein